MSVTSYINKLVTLNMMSSPAFTTAEGQYDAGYAQGLDHFWDAYQCMGGRTDYTNAFQGSCWNDETFKPKYPIKIESYIGGVWNNCDITDLSACIDEIDANEARDNPSWFAGSAITHIPTIRMEKTRVIGALFQNAYNLKIVDELICGDYTDKVQYLWTNIFQNCENLEEIRFGGHITDNVYISGCPKLSKESLLSLLNTLCDKPFEGHSLCNIGETNLAKLTADEIAIATNKGWTIN